MATKTLPNGVKTTYGYDDLDLNLYDANGNRIREISGGNTQNYLVAPNLADGLESTDLVTDGSGNVVADYVYGGSEIIARLDANGDPVYYLTDDMGSVIGLVDGSGNLVSRIVYDGFGDVVSGDDGSSLGGDLRFQGQWLEGESGLYYMRARDYDSQTGLFLSRDAVDVQEQGVEAFNPYQFAYGNPLVFSDPTGMFSITEVNATMSIDNILREMRTIAGKEAVNYAKQRLGEAVGNAVWNIVSSYLPFQGVSSPNVSLLRDIANAGGVILQGTWFEVLIKKAICEVFPPEWNRKIWFEPVVTADGHGTSNPGYRCPTIFENIRTSRGYRRPDFIITEGRPKQAGEIDRSYLVGDIKLSLRSAVRDWVGLDGNPPKNRGQFNAIKGYAYQHVYPKSFGVLTLFDGGAGKVIFRQRLVREALSGRGVGIIIVSLLQNDTISSS